MRTFRDVGSENPATPLPMERLYHYHGVWPQLKPAESLPAYSFALPVPAPFMFVRATIGLGRRARLKPFSDRPENGR